VCLHTVRNILTNRLYAGQARYNYRRPVIPSYRKTEAHQLRSLKMGRSSRAESAWMWSDAPAIIPAALFATAPWQLQRHAETARKRYQPSSGRYLLRTLVKCGACGLGMGGKRQLRVGKQSDYLSYQCTGHAPLTVGRTTRCPAKLVRAERLDTVVWQALSQLLQKPSVIPHLHQTWAAAKQQTLSGLEAQYAPLVQRRQRLERQDQRLLDAYQAEIITLSELQARRQKLAAALQQIEQESRQLAHTRQQSIQWQQVIDNAATFRQLLGDNLEQLSFGERQAITRCLISKVVVTGEEVDIHFVLPFDSPLRWLGICRKSLRGHQDIFIGCVWHISGCHLSPGRGRRRRSRLAYSCPNLRHHWRMASCDTVTPRTKSSSSTSR
jgi:hypothetical protein